MSIWTSTQGTGTDIVVIHGWGMNANVWQPLLPELTSQFRVTQIDLPGFGDSHSLTLSPSLEDICHDILPSLPQQFHVLGWSLGGLVATQLAVQCPQRVLSLATVASSPYFIANDDWPGIKPVLLQQFQRSLRSDFKATIERFMAVQAMGSPHAKQLIKQVRHWIFEKPMANTESLKNGLSLLQQADLRTQLADIQQPFMRFYGRLDSLVPVAVSDLVQALAPQSQQHVFNHCAHTPFVSASIPFAERYRQFLSAV